jgi:hypothetical protein
MLPIPPPGRNSLGHASISITLDRYGHLFPGSGDEAVALVDAYLERTTGAKTGADGPERAPLSQRLGASSQSRKPLSVVRRIEGSNPSPSASSLRRSAREEPDDEHDCRDDEQEPE